MSSQRTQLTADSDGTSTVEVGVIGVGSMGQNHARAYRQLSGTTLVGVTDLDGERAQRVADVNETEAFGLNELLEQVEAVTVSVPTSAHFETARTCLDAGVDVLVEKPFVDDIADGHRLVDIAEREDRVLQVGHIERFNPAVQAMFDVVDGFDVIASTARRVGPPVERPIDDGVIADLMIHDIDVVLALAGCRPSDVDAMAASDGQYATALLRFPNGLVCSLTASRVTQRRARELHITTDECQIAVDYLDQSVEIHRQSHPEYTQTDGQLRYRNECVVERPMVERGEPLKAELSAFTEAVRTRSSPQVTAQEGLHVLEVAEKIEAAAAADRWEGR